MPLSCVCMYVKENLWRTSSYSLSSHECAPVDLTNTLLLSGFGPWATLHNSGAQFFNVIWLSKMRDCDWSYTRHVICTNNHFWPVQRSILPDNITGQYYQQLIFGPNAILGTSIIYSALRNVDFVSCDVTVVSSLKRFISRFLLPFVYLKEF